MISIREASGLLGISAVRLKQIIKQEDLKINRQPNGYIKIPSNTMKHLNVSRGLRSTNEEPIIVCIAQEKGGVSKTTTTILCALAAARRGYSCLVNDWDSEAHASLFLADDNFDFNSAATILEAIEHKKSLVELAQQSRFDGIDFVPSKPLIRKLDKLLVGSNPKTLLKNQLAGIEFYDIVFIDLPPTFSKLSAAAYLNSSKVIMPCDDSSFSLESLNLTISDIEDCCEEFEATLPKLKVLRTKYGNKKRRAAKDVFNELSRDFHEYLLPYGVKESSLVANAMNNGESLFETSGGAEIKSNLNELVDFILSVEQ